MPVVLYEKSQIQSARICAFFPSARYPRLFSAIFLKSAVKMKKQPRQKHCSAEAAKSEIIFRLFLFDFGRAGVNFAHLVEAVLDALTQRIHVGLRNVPFQEQQLDGVGEHDHGVRGVEELREVVRLHRVAELGDAPWLPDYARLLYS